MFALLGALKEETDGILKAMAVSEVINTPECRCFRGELSQKGCLLVRTGMGRQRVENAARFVLDKFRPEALISFGFGGALEPGLRAGDVVLCSEVYYCNGNTDKIGAEKVNCDSALYETAGRSGARTGSGVTVSRLLTDTESKNRLYKSFGSYISDIESYWVGRVAIEAGVPFLAVRAVSDTSGETMPPFDRLMTAEGRWLSGRTIRHFARHSGDLLRLPGLYRASSLARKNLTECICGIVAGVN